MERANNLSKRKAHESLTNFSKLRKVNVHEEESECDSEDSDNSECQDEYNSEDDCSEQNVA